MMRQILIVDDNEHIVRMFDEVLSSQGHKVFVANTGRKAMELIDQIKFDIAFVDLGLSDTSGLNILCYIKNRSPETVSTVISGKSDINYAIDSIKTGAFRYLKKPFDIEDINEVTDQSIHERESRNTNNSSIGSEFQPRKFVKLISDIALLIPALLAGFFIQQEIYYRQEIPIFWGVKEVIYIISSFAFCYAFIFTSKYGESLHSDEFRIRKVIISYSLSFILFAAILFFVTDFIYGRLVLVSGYILGIPALWLSRNIVSETIMKIFLVNREGPRSLTIKSVSHTDITGDETEQAPGKTTPAVLNREPELGNDWGSRLIKEFRGTKSESPENDKNKKLVKTK